MTPDPKISKSLTSSSLTSSSEPTPAGDAVCNLLERLDEAGDDPKTEGLVQSILMHCLLG